MLKKVQRAYQKLVYSSIDARAATELSRLGLPYMPWSSSAMRPSAVATIVNDIIVNNRNNAVEFGAGISTLYIARALKSRGGSIVSFDDDPDWTALVNELLRESGLAGVGRVIHAPQGPCEHALDGLLWYDTSTVASTTNGQVFDLLLADGPIAYQAQRSMARYPAYPLMRTQMAERSAVILDDTDRPGEAEVLRRWYELAGPGYRLRRTQSSIGMLLCGPAFTTEY